MFWNTNQFTISDFILQTTYNPVQDNFPCEYIIYVLTAIDNISHALSCRTLCLLPQLSKICILYRIKYPSYKQVCFRSLQDDECFGTHTNSRLWSVTCYIPTTRYPWCSFLSLLPLPGNTSFCLLLPQWSFLLLLLRSQLVSLQWIYFPFGILIPV